MSGGVQCHGLDADLLQVEQEFSPFRPGSQEQALWLVGEIDQRSPHDLSESVDEVVDGWRLLDPALGQHLVRVMAQDDSPPHAASESEHGIGKISFPGVVILALEAVP
jgi:hypothetical protein